MADRVNKLDLAGRAGDIFGDDPYTYTSGNRLSEVETTK